jgi:hypothetical protein
VCRDEQVVGTDHRAALFEVCSNVRVMGRRLLGQGERLNVTQKRGECGGVLVRSWRDFDAVEQFGLRHD